MSMNGYSYSYCSSLAVLVVFRGRLCHPLLITLGLVVLLTDILSVPICVARMSHSRSF